MKTDGINKLFGRINRIKNRLGIKDGVGTSWDCSLENGEIHKYILKGIKSPEEVEDDIASAFIWLWGLKDHIKKYAKNGDVVEAQVNGNSYLSICADLANGLKHGGLDRKSRSGKTPSLGNLKYHIPQAAIKELAFGAFDVSIDINNAHLVSWEMPILDNQNNAIGDAFDYLDHCINAWELIINDQQKGRL
jgi:hypothetical protein